MVDWRQALEQSWATLRFGEMKVSREGEKYVFEVQVYFSGLDENSVRVELYANGVNGGEPLRQEMKSVGQPGGEKGTIYITQVPATRPASDYTARVLPNCSGVAVPLEAAQILWQR
jgi:starch phosphorylase